MRLTLEEFTEIVKRVFVTERRALTKEDVDAYFETDETKEIVRDKYEFSVKELKTGKITEEVFRIGRTSSIAFCLALMY